MAKQYQATHGINRITSAVARLGIGRTHVMTTTGRKTGERRRVPVSPIVVEGVEYLVSPYGEVGWVHNVRADPTVTLSHGSETRQARLEEVTDRSGAPVMAAYHARESFSRPYMTSLTTPPSKTSSRGEACSRCSGSPPIPDQESASRRSL
jgi:deazaflavin-dependent oxidoreductase (nitroreductase family)